MPLEKDSSMRLFCPVLSTNLSGITELQTEWQLMEKICPARWGWGLNAHLLSLLYHHLQSFGVHCSWEGWCTNPISTPPLYVLCGWEAQIVCWKGANVLYSMCKFLFWQCTKVKKKLTYGSSNISGKEATVIHPFNMGQIHQITEVQLGQLQQKH